VTDPILLTPGPLTTTAVTRAAMFRDWGSWDASFAELTAIVCRQLLDVVHGEPSHACVPLQGSGTFAVEAALGTLVPRDASVLVPSNGAYCERIVRILRVLGRDAVELRFDECEPVDAARVDEALARDPRIGHVALVHCETGTGVVNPLEDVARACARHGRPLIVDAMSSFGALPIDLRATPVDAVVAASGKCLEGVPGMGFVVARRVALEAAEGRAHSLALDLHDQWRYLQRTGQWRFTPPTHVVAALAAALTQYRHEGGLPARRARYEANRDALVAGMRRLGFRPLLDAAVQSPVIVTFVSPDHPRWRFDEFYRRMRDRGFVLYPGKLTRVDTFRVGCIGAIGPAEVDAMLAAAEATLRDMDVALVARQSPEPART
jgi:2-aminoethylphosphonate-pyruvate transaminase